MAINNLSIDLYVTSLGIRYFTDFENAKHDNEWRKVKFIGELLQLLNAFDKRVSFARRWRVKRSLSFHRSLYTGVIVLSSCLKRYIGSRGVFTYHGYSRDRLFSLVFNEISYTFTLDRNVQ